MRKKEVSKRWKSIAEVRASLGVHRAHIGDKLDQRAQAQNVEAFSYQPFFDHMDGELAQVQRNLVTAEDDHVRQLVRLVGLRRQTRELAAGVYDKQVAARRILSGLYGDDRKFELAAIEGATPQAAQVLAEQVDQTVKLLLDPGAAVPTAIVQGVSVDFATLASDLESEAARLLASSEEFQRTRKAVDGTRILKNAAIAQVSEVFPWVAGSLENCFRLAGERDLADRIRTSVRVVTRRQKAPETADSPSGESTPTTSLSENDVSAESGQGNTPVPVQQDADSQASPAPVGG